MIAYKVTFFWRTFEHSRPKVITEEVYNDYKSLKIKPVSIKFDYLKVFSTELIIVAAGIVAIYFEDAIGMLTFLFAIPATFYFISLFISSFFYIDSYLQAKKYIGYLNECILYSESYKVFCKIMGEYDKSYQMQLSRIG